MKSISNDKPKTFEKVNNGSWWYNYHIEAVEVVDPMTEDAKIEYHFERVQVWGTPNDNSVKKAVIADLYTESEEINLQNNYQRFMLGLSDNERYKAEYIEYLKKVDELKKMIDEDLKGHVE